LIVSVTYSFEFPEVCAGQAVNSQLSISSNAHPGSEPLVFSELKITYEGGLKTILLRHDPSTVMDSSPSVKIINLRSSLHEFTEQDLDGALLSPTSIASHTYMVADTDLSIAPGQVRVYELSAILREAGTAKAICGTFGMVNDSFDLDFVVMFGEDECSTAVHPLPVKNVHTTANGGKGVWWKEGADGKVVKRPLRFTPDSLTILPRPPKMEVFARGLENGAYIDEVVKIGLEVVNGEDEDADVGVDVRILGWPTEQGQLHSSPLHTMGHWLTVPKEPEITWLADDGSTLPATPSLHALGNMKPSERITRNFNFPSASIPADCSLEIKLRYNLLSDPETITEKVVSVDMPIIAPFHCTYDFSPRVHHGAWPDYFTLSDELFNGSTEKPQPQGIVQRWCLTANVQGVARDDITIEGWELPLQQVAGAAECNVTATPQRPIILSPSKTIQLPFLIDIHKHSLEDRSPSNLDTTLHLRWRRGSSPTLTTTITPVPRLFVPLREPRVLAEAQLSKTIPGVIHLTYTIENPTNYFLTFALLMEANDAFAFSGPKQSGLQLLPMSRATVEYRVFPYSRGEWVRPSLKVVDRYFNKTLKTSPGGEGTAVDKHGLMVWVPEELLAPEEKEAVEEEEKEVVLGEAKEVASKEEKEAAPEEGKKAVPEKKGEAEVGEDEEEEDSDYEPDPESSEDSLEYREGSDVESEGGEEGDDEEAKEAKEEEPVIKEEEVKEEGAKEE
jgi:hypothetical protein